MQELWTEFIDKELTNSELAALRRDWALLQEPQCLETRVDLPIHSDIPHNLLRTFYY